MSAVFEPVTRSPVTRRERRLRLPAAAADRDFAAPVQPETGQRRRKSPEIPARALLAQLVEHFHGKEGVDGSSPSEGSAGLALLAGFGGWCRLGDGYAEAAMETIWKPRRPHGLGLLVDGRGCPRAGRVAVLQDVLDVRAIPLNREIVHSPAGDGPGRAVFRRGVTPRRGRLKCRCVSRTAAAVDPVDRPDEALGAVLGQDHGHDHDRLPIRALVRTLRRLSTPASPLQSSVAAPARDQSSRAERRTPALATRRSGSGRHRGSAPRVELLGCSVPAKLRVHELALRPG